MLQFQFGYKYKKFNAEKVNMRENSPTHITRIQKQNAPRIWFVRALCLCQEGLFMSFERLNNILRGRMKILPILMF